MAVHPVGQYQFVSIRTPGGHRRYSESEVSFNQAEKLAPGSPRILFARAETYIATKRNTAEARDLLHRYLAANLTPEDPSRSEALRLLRKVEGA